MAVIATMPKRISWDFGPANLGVTPRGSSDNPRTGMGLRDRPLAGLQYNPLPEELMQSPDVVVYKRPSRIATDNHRVSEDLEIDVKGTNKRRMEIALKLGHGPILERPDGPMFRVARHNSDGLLQISYDERLPARFEAFSDSETLPVSIAAKYLGAENADVLKMVASGVLKGDNDNVILADLVLVKMYIGQVDGGKRVERFNRQLAQQDAIVSRAFGLPSP